MSNEALREAALAALDVLDSYEAEAATADRLRAALAAQQAPAPAEKKKCRNPPTGSGIWQGAHSVSDEKGNDPQSTRHSSAPAAPAGWRPTETQIVAAARALNKRHAELCNVNEADSWMIQGDDFREDARAALLAAAPTHTGDAPVTMTRG